MQSKEFLSLTEVQAASKIGELCRKDYQSSGVLASVSAAQMILESGYVKSELAQNANNCFGMKKSLSGNTWSGSSWDGKSIYTKRTAEQKPDGTIYYVTADFRKYSSIEDSVADHSAYLLGAKNGTSLRYAGLKGEKDYRKAIQIIKDGGYATSLSYVSKICNIIEKYNLTQYDVLSTSNSNSNGGNSMNIVQSILTKNPCYTAGRKITVKGLMLHSVGCPQPRASVFINNWNSASYDRACVHGFIDGLTGNVYQTLPWNHRGWHAGGSANNTHIGVEMCEPDCIKYTGGASFTCSDKTRAVEIAKRTYQSAVELFAYLCKEYNLNPTASGVIVSHKEGCARGIASNHGDPEHLWKGLGLSYTMDKFRSDVKAAMGSGTTIPTEPAPSNPSPSNTSFPNTPFTVQVLITDLNYRSQPSMNGAVNGQTGKGVFTITEVKDGWGKLKSGAGWIYLENASYVKVGNSVSSSAPVTESPKVPYAVRVSIDDLNIRKGPGTNYAKTGKFTGKGVFTLVQESSGSGSTKGWGKLKSGAGWISLDYCTKV